MEYSNGAVKTAFDIQVDGKHGPGGPCMGTADMEGLQRGSQPSTLMIDIPRDQV